MEELAKLIINYGVSTVIVILFIWDWVTNKKKINETLEQNTKFLGEMKVTNSNTSKSLELLQESMNTQTKCLYEHDKKASDLKEDLKEIKFLMEKVR